MSNFNIFDQRHLKLLLEPFAPGMFRHITPIKYEAISPDSFVLLFRTTAPSEEQHFFISLETDHISSLEGAKCTIEDWYQNSIKSFLPLHASLGQNRLRGVDDYKAQTTGLYFGLLTEVERPTFKGYWSDAVFIAPGDNIGKKINHFSPYVQATIRKTLQKLLRHTDNIDTPFSESFKQIKQDTMIDDINQTQMAVSLYVQPDGRIEYFYNHVFNQK